MNKIYLIDGENVSIKGISEDVPKLEKCATTFIIFYNTECSAKLSLSEFSELTDRGRIQLQLIPAYCGEPNALDFQLSSYLGYLISDYINSKENLSEIEFTIITRDKGFAPLSNFWKSFGINIKIQEHLVTSTSKVVIKSDYVSVVTPKTLIKNDNKYEESSIKHDDILGTSAVAYSCEANDMDEFSALTFNNIIHKEPYSHKENGYHSCYLEKELREIKRASERNPKDKVSAAGAIVKRITGKDADCIRYNKSKLKSVLVLDNGESYDIISFIIYYSHSTVIMKQYLNAWLTQAAPRKIEMIMDSLEIFVNKDVNRFVIYNHV